MCGGEDLATTAFLIKRHRESAPPRAEGAGSGRSSAKIDEGSDSAVSAGDGSASTSSACGD